MQWGAHTRTSAEPLTPSDSRSAVHASVCGVRFHNFGRVAAVLAVRTNGMGVYWATFDEDYTED
jgi:hypothetical protein